MRRNLMLLALLAVALVAYTLTRPPRGPRPPLAPVAPDSALNPKAVAAVMTRYNNEVLPLFKRACMDCHSSQTVFPWYHRVPGVAQFLDDHIEEARRRLDLSDGIPHNADRPLIRQLHRISGDVKNKSMPLWSYKLMHPEARLSDDERAVIVKWADESQAQLSATAKAY